MLAWLPAWSWHQEQRVELSLRLATVYHPSPIPRAVGTRSIHGHHGLHNQPQPRVCGNSSAGAHSARHAAAFQFKALFGQRLSQRMGRVVQPLCM